MRCSTKQSLHLLAALLLLLTNQGLCWKCDVNEKICEVWLDIHHSLTMMKDHTLIVTKNGLLFPYDATDFNSAYAVSKHDVITGDGWAEPRIVITVNGTMPGPAIEVHEGQTVRIHLQNNMETESTSVHFHGQVQKGTPWMDGVGMITQCPLHPGQSFTHEFKADPVGTFWYHAHMGDQRGMGLQGAFIVHPRQGASDLYDREFNLLVQDFNHDWDSTMMFFKMLYGMYVNGKKESSTSNLSGARYSLFRAQSVLINGRARFGDIIAPLEEYTVRQNNLYRFRVIHAGSVYALQLSIDGHKLKVVATDGIELKYPELADEVILTAGERYDFELNATEAVGNYWIKIKTLELEPHVGQAILRYEGAPEGADPTTQPRQCTSDHNCVVVNCPFLHFPEESNTICINAERLRSADPIPDDVGLQPPTEIKEYFLNFAFPGTNFTPASVNGIQFANPSVPAQSQPDELDSRCPGDGYRCSEDTLCLCTGMVDLQHGEVAQFIFTNMGRGQGWDHPIHMHGHSFWVLKIGYPEYNTSTGQFIHDNTDIDCRGNPDRALSYCNQATWKNPGWSGNTVPGLELHNPVQKDTINVPTGGYVVVRIKADNPGMWSLHCHVSLHLSDGMFTLLNESFAHQPPPPRGFPECRDFNLNYKGKTEGTSAGSGSAAGPIFVAAALTLVWILWQ